MGYCDSCFAIAHTYLRNDHVEEQISTYYDDAVAELLSVLCFENSHYVCFTRIDDQWLFFDSMFDRQCKLIGKVIQLAYFKSSIEAKL